MNIEEGALCPHNWQERCKGRLVYQQKPCYCATTYPPCGACTSGKLVCDDPECGEIADEGADNAY